jgi:hypothetical protein
LQRNIVLAAALNSEMRSFGSMVMTASLAEAMMP